MNYEKILYFKLRERQIQVTFHKPQMSVLHILGERFHLWPLGFLCFGFETSFWILALGMSEIQKLTVSGCPVCSSQPLIPFLARQKWCLCSVDETTSQRKFCECPCEPGELRADTCILPELCFPSSLSCVSASTVCTSPHASSMFHPILTILSIFLLLTSFVKSRCLNVDQADRGKPRFLQICKMQVFSLSWGWPAQHRQWSDAFRFCCLSPKCISLPLSMDKSYSYIRDCLSHISHTSGTVYLSYAFSSWSNVPWQMVMKKFPFVLVVAAIW